MRIIVLLCLVGCDKPHEQPKPEVPPRSRDAAVDAAAFPGIEIGGIAAAPGDSAVIGFRNQSTDAHYIARYAGKQVLWTVPVGGSLTSFDFAVGDDLVAVRYQADHVERVAALDLASGTRRWSADVRPLPDYWQPMRGHMLVVETAIAVRSGEHEGIFLRLTDGTDAGTLKNISNWDRLEAIGPDVIDHASKPVLAAINNEHRLLRTLRKARDPRLRSLGWMDIKRRGLHDGNEVFVVLAPQQGHALVVVSPTGRVVVDVAFPDTVFRYDDASTEPGSPPPRLPRFVPFDYDAMMSNGALGAAVSVVDLEQGTSTVIAAPDTASPWVLRHGDDWLVAIGTELISVAGDSGVIQRAKMKYPTTAIFDRQLRDNALWLAETKPHDRLVVERVDATTLVPQLSTDLVRPH